MFYCKISPVYSEFRVNLTLTSVHFYQAFYRDLITPIVLLMTNPLDAGIPSVWHNLTVLSTIGYVFDYVILFLTFFMNVV